MQKTTSAKPQPDAHRPPQEIVEQLYELLQIKRSANATTKEDFSDKVFMTTLKRQEHALYAELRASLAPPRRKPGRKKAGYRISKRSRKSLTPS